MQRTYSVHLLLTFLCLSSTLGIAQKSECASISTETGATVLTAKSWDPVVAISRTLADAYGISVSVEAPQWDFPHDTEDVATADPQYSASHNNIHYQLMKRHEIRVRFSAGGDSKQIDVPALLRQIAEAANKEMPYGYRLEISGKDYALVPTKTLGKSGSVEKIEPLLDRHVTIPEAARSISEHAKLMADQLSQQTGLHVSCCQAFVAGVPWGKANVSYGATDKSAREVLKALMTLEHENNAFSSYEHYIVGCDGTGAPWCFIEVQRRYGLTCK